MTRITFIFCLLICSGCFNNSTKETEQLGCGVVDTFPSKEIKNPYVFNARCATCHHFYKNGTGPKMEDILDRIPSEEWLRNYITNEDSLIEAKDEYALKAAQWSPVRGVHNHADLSKQDLDTLIKFITQ